MAFLTIKDFPDDLHRKAKSEAALEGISLKALFIKAVEEYLKKKNRPADPCWAEQVGKLQAKLACRVCRICWRYGFVQA